MAKSTSGGGISTKIRISSRVGSISVLGYNWFAVRVR
jgi:hypothetical protein